jgi:hypothetical protein
MVIDEQRSHGPKIGPPQGVAQGGSLASVAALAGAISPCCTLRLASEPPWAITVRKSGRFWVYALAGSEWRLVELGLRIVKPLREGTQSIGRDL